MQMQMQQQMLVQHVEETLTRGPQLDLKCCFCWTLADVPTSSLTVSHAVCTRTESVRGPLD